LNPRIVIVVTNCVPSQQGISNFSLKMKINYKVNYHKFADDLQIYISHCPHMPADLRVHCSDSVTASVKSNVGWLNSN